MNLKKVTLAGEVLLDLGGDTALEADVVAGKTFHKSNGEPAVGEYVLPSGELEINENGVYDVNKKDSVKVNVQPPLEEKAVKENCVVKPSEGFYGLSEVTVSVPIPEGFIIPSGVKEIAVNGEHNVTEYARVKVDVPQGLPLEVSTEAKMNNILSTATESELGKVYKYTGETTDSYENGAIYIIEEAE